MKPGDCKEMFITAKIKALYYKAMKKKIEEQQLLQYERKSNIQIDEVNGKKSPYISVEGPSNENEKFSKQSKAKEIDVTPKNN